MFATGYLQVTATLPRFSHGCNNAGIGSAVTDSPMAMRQTPAQIAHQMSVLDQDVQEARV